MALPAHLASATGFITADSCYDCLVPAVQELWTTWEIHCLILVSLFLQVFLFLFAGMRPKHSPVAGLPIRLSADSVAIFVLGHLAVRAGEPGHQLMSFWAPFVLVHLGGQGTITAFSKQDNELWTRHLLNLVTQAAVAGYVMAKASWPDHRLRADMVLMFLSGCFKYAERTTCLYSASPARLSSDIMGMFSWKLQDYQYLRNPELLEQRDDDDPVEVDPGRIVVIMLDGTRRASRHNDIMSVDAPLNEAGIINNLLDHLPNIYLTFLDNPDWSELAYESVGACLVRWYEHLYTKNPFRQLFYAIYQDLFRSCSLPHSWDEIFGIVLVGPFITLVLLYPLFQYVSTPIALVLFAAAEKGGRLHTSQGDITVSYILLVGAIVLDVSSAIISIFSYVTSILPHGGMIKSAILRVAHYIQLVWSRKQWSEVLAQYSMIKRHAVQDTSGITSIRQWISKLLGSWGIELFDVTHTPISKDDAPIKEFILDNLLHSGTRKEWNIASSRGQLAVEKWRESHQDTDSARAIGKALENIVTSGVDVPTTVLIWHIATDICYFREDEASTKSSDGQLKKHKEMSRELSNYIMYLVFKCGVMLTSISQYVHEEAHPQIRTILLGQQGQISLGEKAAVMKLFDAKKEEQQDIQKHEEPADSDNSHLQKLAQSAKAITSPVLPRAREVAQALISIDDEADRWDLIASVWSEMLFYTAPRCGCAFHYKHLSTGGEFITHVLVLMKSLGPFLPPPGA